MNINRDNYELFFLMYVDKELSAEDQQAVELFAAANPDLQNELTILQETVVSSDDVVFVPKTMLYKSTEGDRTIQESMLLHLDNELPAASVSSLEKSIQENSEIKAEWNLLTSTRLNKNDKIVYANKEELYRHEAKVIGFRYWRAAAAAILIGGGLFFAASLMNQKPEVIDVATVKPSVNNTNPAVNNTIAEVKDNGTAPQTTIVPDENQIAAVNSTKPNTGNEIVSTVKNISTTGNSQKLPVTITTVKEDFNNLASNENDDRYVEQKKINNNSPEREMAISFPDKTNQTIPVTDIDMTKRDDNIATLAVHNEGESENKILYMNEDKVTRSKLGGFIRKVKRVVDRNTKIKTSDGLRIGGFELAIK